MKPRISVVLATGNAGKVREFGRLLAATFSVLPLPEGVSLPEETGRTFAENARLKAQAVFGALGGRLAVLADDSGLEVTAMAGRPGVHSARFAGVSASDADNVARLLHDLAGSAERSAQFVCALCLAMPRDAKILPGALLEVEGVTRGTIALVPRGTRGFGYDPVFRPIGWEITLAEASPSDKDRVSHRGAAAHALLEALERAEGG